MIKEMEIRTNGRNEMLNITHEIQKAVSEADVREGIVILHIPHTTAAVTINENADPDVAHDMMTYLSELVPKKSSFRHAEGNSDSHIKSTLTGCDQTIIITNGKLLLGTWQSIYFCEFDGPRNRRYYIKVIEG